ncbi:MAG: hypothetical protein ACR2QW_04565 [bacterium]
MAEMGSSSGSDNKHLACVIGDISLVRALGVCNIPVAIATNEPSSNITLSRYCEAVVTTPSWITDPEKSVATIIDWGKLQSVPPVLFYQGDHDLLAVSRARKVLAPHFHFVLPRAELVEDLADKLRFFELAERKQLQIPDTLILAAGCDIPEHLQQWDRFPCVLKPAIRTHWYQLIGDTQKALRIETRMDLDRLLHKIGTNKSGLIVQAAIEGGEENIVSYHAYVRPGGEIVAEFTGRKIRTYRRLYGVSSYVKITDDVNVRNLGRAVVERLDFSGVLKIDFKQDVRDKQIYLLEINPRFNLWHHPATIAGVGIPEAVYQDCVEPGSAKPARRARIGVRWMDPWADRMAFKDYVAAGELTPFQWIIQMITVEVNEGFRLSDPLPWLADLILRCRTKLAQIFIKFRVPAEDR